MSPRHVSPSGTIRIVLEIQVIHTVFVEHPVRVVHPAVCRRMVIKRTELLAVRRIKRVRQLHLLPTDSRFGHPLHVERQILTYVCRQVERHIVIHLLAGKADVDDAAHRLVINHKINLSFGRIVLHRKQQILLRFLNLKDILFTHQMAHVDRRFRHTSY